ncbi:A/G-specific adenine glycosylase [Paraferrimonas sedimenticola]|uniref:Adenine DNA glycosylase n=1 Tax=Paraferrimonas sedimenticola TaxID=375674 RepID=A0AA37RZ96_9GAMM|nr:A/G-specific adenine glycosylase [Paraferrimonas sedimenticola]GLP98106.1 A/G-specific adenine glycosylase [Paraferrimonas sedimenticola]
MNPAPNSFSQRLISWQKQHGRHDLPWQQNPTAYRVWVSEIMLQQTQVTTVIPYFERFMASFDSISALAAAPLDQVLHHWTGLGYYARARNLHKAAQTMVADFGGEFPDNLDDAISLPGVGRSTASAILTFSKGAQLPILDGNVKRVLARHGAIEGWPGKTSVQKALWALSEELTPSDNAAVFNQGMMDLGSSICRRGQPLCSECPVAKDCKAQLSGRQREFPNSKPKKEKPVKQTQMLLLKSGDTVFLQARPAAGIWGGLYCPLDFDDRAAMQAYLAEHLGGASAHSLDAFRHTFSHYHLDIEAHWLELEPQMLNQVMEGPSSLWYNLVQPQQVGLAAATERLLQAIQSKE